ncbi:MAG: PEP-CTERM sorting domain-containing protein [Planctomycetota bacterium]
MTQLRFATHAFVCTLLFVSLLATQASGDIFNDSFADGDRAATGTMDTNWWTSSSSSGIEASAGSLGLVTGTSGRGIHTVFATQTLANVGDSLIANYSFTAPATIGSTSSSFRVGLFDTLGRAGLNADISASSSSPNSLYGDTGTGGTEIGLPGYMLDMDVNPSAGNQDFNFRDHNTGSATGRLMATTGSGSFSSFSSGPDETYTFGPGTMHTGSFMITRISATELELTAMLDGAMYSVIDSSVDSFEFGFLGFHANSNTFGSSNSQGAPDNGIDFTNISVRFTSAIPEPGSAGLLIGLAAVVGSRRRKG